MESQVIDCVAQLIEQQWKMNRWVERKRKKGWWRRGKGDFIGTAMQT